ncbi:MAG TPA: succinate dehydrogenase cytochrome b subunit [Bacteroidales bacterium]|nr:succinate dehydrogenase cytochrome b subunit [Bacteroidales bacterium]
MLEIFNSSIGKKLIMSITGLFLMLFLVVHLTVNLMLLVGDGEVFNRAAHFMGTNPAVRVIEPILAIGFIFHIFYATYITLQNRKKRPIGYTTSASNGLSTWSSKNIYILGATIFIFLVIHLANFFWKLKFESVETITYGDETMPNAYALVAGLFTNYWWYDLLYVIGAISLGLHLSHGFWAAFQTLGWNGTKWLKRLEVVAYVYAIVIGTGFSIIPIYFFLFK